MEIQPGTSRMSLQLPWGKVHVNLSEGSIIVLQQWSYHWEALQGADPWTDEERLRYSRRVTDEVRGAFQGYRLGMTRDDGSRGTVGLRIDVQPCADTVHWYVTVRKVSKESSVPVSVNFSEGHQTIGLTESELSIKEAARVLRRKFVPMLVAELNRRVSGLSFQAY